MLRYRAVLFDLDGTLVDSSKDIISSIHYALGQVFSAHKLPADDDILVLIGRPLESIIRDLGYPADGESARRFAEEYRSYYAEHYNDTTKPFPGVRQLLERLRQAGAKIGLVSTKQQIQAEFTLAGIGLSCFFDYVRGWDVGRKHKPDPEPVVASLERLEVPPGQALMVGDSELDIEAARAAGVDACAVTYGFRPAWFLGSMKPKFLVACPDEIIPIVINSDDG